jgi:hypothetical protein
VFYKPKYHYYNVVHRPSCCGQFNAVYRPRHYSHYYES